VGHSTSATGGCGSWAEFLRVAIPLTLETASNFSAKVYRNNSMIRAKNRSFSPEQNAVSGCPGAKKDLNMPF
jgi:hypothetical protein